MSLKQGYVLDLDWTVADITNCIRSYGYNRTCFEFPTNIPDVRASTFGEFEHLKNLRTCLLLRVGGSLYNNQFVFYAIINIIICFDTIMQ